MARYDVFISCAHKDGMEIAEKLAELLTERGISVFDDRIIPLVNLNFGFGQIPKMIINECRFFIPIITEGYLESNFAKRELILAINYSEGRAKTIIPVMTKPIIISADYDFILRDIPFLCPDNPDDIPWIAKKISDRILTNNELDNLYERLSEYEKIKNENKAAETICKITEYLIKQFYTSDNIIVIRKICTQILHLYEKLFSLLNACSSISKETAGMILVINGKIRELLLGHIQSDSGSFFVNDLYFCALAVRIVYYAFNTEKECFSVLGKEHEIIYAEHVGKQAVFADAYRTLTSDKSLISALSRKKVLSEEDVAFIMDTPRFFLPETAPESESKVRVETVVTPEDEILQSVAHFMQEGNKLFDVLQNNKMEGSFMRCLLTSYERLKAYCEVVGAKDIAAECIDRIIELRNIVEKQENEQAEDGKAEKGIKSLLGFTLQESGSYDVFISFKSEDSDLAEKIYRYCQRRMKMPSWSKRSLPELSKSEYEDAIYNALDKSKHFVVVLSKLEYLNSNWVREEMETFHSDKLEGRKGKESNFIFVVTDDLYETITKCKKTCLETRFRKYQIIKMSEYENDLIQYLN